MKKIANHFENNQISKELENFAEVLELEGGNKFKSIAYQKASEQIKNLSQSVESVYESDGLEGLEKIEGVGASIAEKIEQLFTDGKIRELEKLKKQFPPNEVRYLDIPGIGPKTAKYLYENVKARNIKELKVKLEKYGEKYFKPKTLKKILLGIDIYDQFEQRMLLNEADEIAREIIIYLQDKTSASNITAVGSLRRKKETIGDIDIVASSDDPKDIIDVFTKYGYFDRVINRGETKCTVIHRTGCQVDLEILPREKFGSLLLHFTGSKNHNIALRNLALEKNMSLSEHGIKTQNKLLTFESEDEVYKKLGLQYIEPELREDQGEIEAARKHSLPDLIKLNDIRGDLHLHSNWSDGTSSIEEIVKEAISIGYEYIAISDHTVSLRIAGGMNEDRFIERKKEIERLREKFKNIKILDSCEANIMEDGTLDLPDDFLKSFDIVTASVHSVFSMSEKKMTERFLSAIRNPRLNIISHPTGRIINRRPGYSADWKKIFTQCEKKKVSLEINSFPDRLDLNDKMVMEALKHNVRLVINTDSHKKEHLKFMTYGVSVARRGWAKKINILNTRSYNQLIKEL